MGVGGRRQLQSSTAGIILNPGKRATESGKKTTEIGKTKIGFNGGGTSSSHENWRRTEVERWHGAHRGRIVCWRARTYAYTLRHGRAREPPTAHAYRTRRASATAISQTVAHTHPCTLHTHIHTHTQHTRARRASETITFYTKIV